MMHVLWGRRSLNFEVSVWIVGDSRTAAAAAAAAAGTLPVDHAILLDYTFNYYQLLEYDLEMIQKNA